MLCRRNAINLVTAKGAERGKKKREREREKCQPRVSFLLLLRSCECVREGGASVLTDTGSSWVVRGLHIHHFCVQINLTPTPLWSPLPLLFFLFSLSISGLHSCTVCACKHPRAHWDVYEPALHPLKPGEIE